MKFTDADFISAAPSRPVRREISMPNLRLPVAPPSPLFNGINEDINSTRFPAFEDVHNIRKNVPTQPSHCTLHCNHGICVRLMLHGHGLRECQCVPDEQKSRLTWYRPAMELEELHLMSIADAVAKTSPSDEIEIHLDDAMRVLAHLEPRATIQAMGDEYLRAAIRDTFGDDERYATAGAVHHLFHLMRIYFDRTLSSAGHRIVTIDQLRCELDVYVWTLLWEWVELYCHEETQSWVLQDTGPMCVLNADFGAPAAVLELWYGCVEDIVGILVWRDEEVRWRRVESVVVLCVLAVMFLSVVVLGLWGDLVSHI